MKEYAKEFYTSERWQQCRKAYMQKVGGLCERCLQAGNITPAKIIHHKTYITERNINQSEVTLNFDNLEALCQECHNKEHNTKLRRYSIGEGGELIF